MSVVCPIVPDHPGGAIDPVHERRHHGAEEEEWVFTCWAADGSLGALSGQRVLGATGWYWAALVRADEPVLHVAEYAVPVRADPTVIKAHGLWAEHVCEAPMEQWTVANECFATALDDPADALGNGYGIPTAIAFDLEWYATGPATPLVAGAGTGYEQAGVVHGVIELPGATRSVSEIPAHRWHRWGSALGPLPLAEAYAHGDLVAAFAFPDASVVEWVVTPDGWRSRRP